MTFPVTVEHVGGFDRGLGELHEEYLDVSDWYHPCRQISGITRIEVKVERSNIPYVQTGDRVRCKSSIGEFTGVVSNVTFRQYQSGSYYTVLGTSAPVKRFDEVPEVARLRQELRDIRDRINRALEVR